MPLPVRKPKQAPVATAAAPAAKTALNPAKPAPELQAAPAAPAKKALENRELYCGSLIALNTLAKQKIDKSLRSEGADRIVMVKSTRQLYLLNSGKVIAKYMAALGPNAIGDKVREGDMRTPEGLYWIDNRNPNSPYYLSLHVSYPNAKDIAQARMRGVSPGGAIMIHGLPVNPYKHAEIAPAHPMVDWTHGCMAVNDKQIREIWQMVRLNTPIEICAGPKTYMPTDRRPKSTSAWF